jgi:hypothetical protein
MRTAVNLASCFNAMTQYMALTMGAMRSHSVNCALETVECHRSPGPCDLERLVVIVSAHIACSHVGTPVVLPERELVINATFFFTAGLVDHFSQPRAPVGAAGDMRQSTPSVLRSRCGFQPLGSGRRYFVPKAALAVFRAASCTAQAQRSA